MQATGIMSMIMRISFFAGLSLGAHATSCPVWIEDLFSRTNVDLTAIDKCFTECSTGCAANAGSYLLTVHAGRDLDHWMLTNILVRASSLSTNLAEFHCQRRAITSLLGGMCSRPGVWKDSMSLYRVADYYAALSQYKFDCDNVISTRTARLMTWPKAHTLDEDWARKKYYYDMRREYYRQRGVNIQIDLCRQDIGVALGQAARHHAEMLTNDADFVRFREQLRQHADLPQAKMDSWVPPRRQKSGMTTQ